MPRSKASTSRTSKTRIKSRTPKNSTREGKPVTLKPVAVADDGSVILATRANARTGGFRVQVNDALLELVRQAQVAMEAQAQAAVPESEPEPPPPPPRVPRVASKLSPREIQALLRQGRSASSIAKKAGVEVEWIQRFEGPIQWERAGMATRAQRATLVRSRMGASKLPLGEAVTANLKSRGVVRNGQPSEIWDAVRHPRKKVWTVSCTFTARGRSGVARWEYDPRPTSSSL